MMNLPDGCVARSARMEDAQAACVLFNCCSEILTGEQPHGEEDLVVEWRTPGFDMHRDTRVVIDEKGDLAGYGEVWDIDEPHVRIHAWGRVHPDHHGRGIGSALIDWQEKRAREAIRKAPEDARVTLGGGALEHDGPARQLLEDHGFHIVRSFSRMLIEMDAEPAPATWPEGITVRSFRPEEDFERTIQSVRDSFSDHWGHVETPYEEELKQWRHWIDEDPHFDPSLWLLAEAGDEIAGVCLGHGKRHEDEQLGWIHVLGVTRPWRRRGIALALLRHAFGVFHGIGKTKVGLGVDATSLTGAHRLYEKAGMFVKRQSLAYEKELRPGIDLSRQTLDESEET